MLKLPSMLKTPRHRRFELKTRYYDAEREARNERLQKLQAEMTPSDATGEILQMKIRDGFRRHRSGKFALSSKQSNFRIILIAGILAALSYLILK